MTGLDKIIERILKDAKDRAREILEAAQRECRTTAESYADRADKTRDAILERAEREGEALIARARSAAAMTRRSILLAARSAVIDEAFEGAKREIRATDYGKYRALLSALLTSALLEEARAARESAALGDELTEFDTYEVIFNAEDRELYGKAVLEDARRAAQRHIGEERAAKLRLSEETADIDGGVILRYGDIEANCSLSMLMNEMRGELEQRVSALLFPQPLAEQT
ncbi:MAG: hypothetical protein E7663_06185 [Ruminococcaceae bacterium]|nr:hypothetical protein [Oscillospiraceae bacterium]